MILLNCFQCRFIGMYLMLPETEGYSLEEIDQYFSNSRRKFNDIYISRKHKTCVKNVTRQDC